MFEYSTDEQEHLRAERAESELQQRLKAERLTEKLRALGIDPDQAMS